MRHLILPFFLALAAFAAPVRALTQDDILQASLLSGYPVEGGQMAGLLLTLTPGWKTYWRAPGEAGIPPQFDWSGSQNVKSVRIHWPVPAVFHLNGMQTIGYHDQVLLPLEVTPRDPGQPVSLRLRMELGICKDICMPARLDLARDLDQTAHMAAIKAALRARPERLNDVARCEVSPSKQGLDIAARITMPTLGPDEVVAIEADDPTLWVGEAAVSRQGGTLSARAVIYTSGGAAAVLDRSSLRLTVLSQGRAVEIKGCPAP